MAKQKPSRTCRVRIPLTLLHERLSLPPTVSIAMATFRKQDGCIEIRLTGDLPAWFGPAFDRVLIPQSIAELADELADGDDEPAVKGEDSGEWLCYD